MDTDSRTNADERNTHMHGQGRSGASGRAKTLRSAAIGLGIFSIGLGLVELLAPRSLARATGLGGRVGLVRAYGLREIASGVGLLANCDDPGPWLWARVAGDALDMATLATRATVDADGARNARLGMAMASPIGALDLMFALMAQSRTQARAAAFFDYSDRVGFRGSPEQLRGAGRDAPVPTDLRVPPALRPYAEAAEQQATRTRIRSATEDAAEATESALEPNRQYVHGHA